MDITQKFTNTYHIYTHRAPCIHTHVTDTYNKLKQIKTHMRASKLALPHNTCKHIILHTCMHQCIKFKHICAEHAAFMLHVLSSLCMYYKCLICSFCSHDTIHTYVRTYYNYIVLAYKKHAYACTKRF